MDVRDCPLALRVPHKYLREDEELIVSFGIFISFWSAGYEKIEKEKSTNTETL